MNLSFIFLSTIGLSERKKLKLFLKDIIKKENQRFGYLNIIFCSDAYLLEINKLYLNHHFYTDIITFDLRSKDSKKIEGEIYISIERVKENAYKFKSTIKEELHRVIFHGVLHLCGYSDKKPIDKTLMTQKENHYLQKYF
jgi:probable rRNA maturation factor